MVSTETPESTHLRTSDFKGHPRTLPRNLFDRRQA